MKGGREGEERREGEGKLKGEGGMGRREQI